MGGDEFVVFPIRTAGDDIDMNVSRLQNNIDLHNSREAPASRISLSVGVSFYNPESPCSVEELLAKADNVMYEHKQLKRSRGH